MNKSCSRRRNNNNK